MTVSRFVVPEPPRDLWEELDAFDQGQHAALEQDRDLARAAARRGARAQATTADGRKLIDGVLGALQRAHRDGAYHFALLHGERVVRCRYAWNGKLHVVANAVRSAAEDALRSAGLEVIRSPGSSWDLDVCRARADRDSAPPSTTRPLLAADTEYRRLRRIALDAFEKLNEQAGNVGPGIQLLGGANLSDETRRDLRDLGKELSTTSHFPSQGNVVETAKLCAQKARDVAVETTHEELAVAAWGAAEACVDLARRADEWTIRQAGGGA